MTIEKVRELLVTPPTVHTFRADGLGLRNAETNFWADSSPLEATQAMLGQAVTIRATPIRYFWDYGDGTPTRTTMVPGYELAEFDVQTPTSHVYKETGTYDVRLSTVYAAQCQVAGGPWQFIPGTITLESEPVVADIWRLETRNVAEDCIENPAGWGCSGFIED
ncbi:MAG: PKD domain-containing protein [Micrococcus sp.]|nr:PKD domain-containing protein [Micrococcus sp.]